MLPMVQPEPVIFNCGGHSVDGAATPTDTLPPSLTPESEVDEFVDIFFDVDVGDNTFPRIESCDLQLGDTWRGMQSKMSVAAPVKKQRKKSENKPQSQINKCHNEKKRRELENETINQLEELLGTCLAEVKQPDKNGIVREATRQIQDVLQRRRECPGECPLRATCLSPVQAGEVTSTQPQALNAPHHYSELTTLIEALKHYTNSLGWVLLEINAKGEIECVTENIKEFTLQDRTELYKKPIFSCLHVNDHAKLRPLLRNIQTFAWGSGEVDRFHAIQVRLIVKNTNGTEGANYVESVIHAAPVRGPSSEEAGSVMCVIRRCEDASAALLPVDGGPPAIAAKPSDHIVFRLDSNSYTILSCDLSAVETNINSPVSIVGTRYLELVESGDRLRLVAHLREAQCYPAPPIVSDPFRIRIATDRPWLRVSARSRLFRANPTSGDPDFIMSTHTVLGDEELELLEAENPRPTVGGPLMTSVANGESSESRYRASMSPAEPPPFSINDFDLEPWASTFQLGDMSSDDSKDRKDSSEGRSTPLTPRAPSTPGDVTMAGASGEEPNRLRILLSKKPTPGEQMNSNNRILKDLLKQEDDEATGSETSAPHTPLTPHTPHTPAAALSPLHPAQVHSRPPHPAHGAHNAHNTHGAHTVQHAAHNVQHSHNSDVLLRILNEKTDEDSGERRNAGDNSRNTSQPSALLSQLLQSTNGPSGNGRSQDGSDNYMERIAGVKRKLEEAKAAASNAKRATPDNQQVTSSAVSAATSSSSTVTCQAASMSPLCQKNKILVSLLARQQITPTTPPPLPNPNLRAYSAPPRPRPPPPHQLPPQRHHHSTLSTILTDVAHRANSLNGGAGGGGGAGGDCPPMHGGQSHLQMVLQGAARGTYGQQPTPAPLHYATPAPHHAYNNHPPSGSSRNQGPGQGQGAGDSEVPSDQTLSDILDEVIDNMPDADRSAPEGVKEKNAMINAIRQSLMQCETVSKSPVSSPGTPPVAYPVQSPGSINMGGSSGGGNEGAGGPGGQGGPHYGAAEAARARALAEQHRTRLLQMQRSQHMVVSREAAEQPQQDLGSTINALVSATPPNVALTRTDYHHLYHPSNQMGGSNYGTNKITSSQQNPMLSRQLSGSGSSGYSHSVAMASGVHTPMTPYHRAPRPQLVGGYYEDGGYCGEYARRTPHHAHPPHDTHLPCAGNGGGVVGGGVGGAGGGTSEYVRNELRAVVGARSARPDHQPQLQPPDLDQLMTFDMTTGGGGSVVGARTSSTSANTWESQQSIPSTTEAGSAEAGAAAGGDEAAGAGAEAGAGAGAGGASAKASLLQKLLSQ